MTNERIAVLKSLVEFSPPLAELRTALKRFEWDSDLPAAQVEVWADTVESREDLGFSDGVKQVISELANPTLNPELTQERARTLIHKLARQQNDDV